MGTDYLLSKGIDDKTIITFTPTGLTNIGSSKVNATYSLKTGSVSVQEGSLLTAPTSNANVGGRIALIGANVNNAGTIFTPDGQTILAAGFQVGLIAHQQKDPSLRGLDVYVGRVDSVSAGTATNTGLIDAPRANVTITGKAVNQLGVINSSTSVSLNGRVDLIASYNAVNNPSYDAVNLPNDPAFLFKNTGIVEMGLGSVIQILPESSSTTKVIGTQLALPSLINIRGNTVHLATDSVIYAPGAKLPSGISAITPVDNTNTALGAGATLQYGKAG